MTTTIESIGRRRSWLAVVLACGAMVSHLNAAALPDADSVVELPPYRVLADMLTISFRSNGTGIISHAEVTQVTPHSPADQRDIEPLDELIAIDDVPVVGGHYDQVSEAVGQQLSPGTTLKLSFVGHRGFFNLRRIKYDFTIVCRVAKPR